MVKTPPLKDNTKKHKQIAEASAKRNIGVVPPERAVSFDVRYAYMSAGSVLFLKTVNDF